MEKLNKKYFITKILIFTKLPNPIPETRVSELVFITIPCHKFWVLEYIPRFLMYRVT
jgi:hypothetical protein